MHKRRTAAASALLIFTASLTSVATPAGATSAATLYVDNTSAACTDSGTGTATAPFCTIQAAADIVAPGQTVLIGGYSNNYNQDVKVKTSGTSAAPITFKAAHTYFDDSEPDHAFTLTGVSNIVIDGLFGVSSDDTVLVSGSSDITIENSTLRQGASSPTSTIAGVHVTGSSSAVTLKQDWFNAFNGFNGPSGVGVRVDGGSTGTVIASDNFDTPGANGIMVVGATGTEIAGNTLRGYDDCAPLISVTAASATTSVENNVLFGVAGPFNACPAGSTLVDLLVSADSAATTTAKYNVLSTDYGYTTPYQWAGAQYSTAAALQQSAGQGAQDLLTDSVSLSTSSLPTSSPMIDSADADAPGEQATDFYGNPRVDDAAVANTGTGSGYYDRGAVEYQEYTSSSLDLGLGSAQYAVAQLDVKGVAWGSSVTETINWGDGTPESVSESTPDMTANFRDWFGAGHVYDKRGTYTVTDTVTDGAGTTTHTGTITTAGSTYQPVAPTRVLDTRNGTGTGGKTTAVPAHGSVTFSVTSGVAGAPAVSSITAVVLNVTVTAPKAAGFITAYPDGTAVPNASNLNYSAGETVPNLVTVKVGADGKAALFNGSSGTAHLVADVEGYYVASTSGGGYTPVSPTRLLDTRNGTGVSGSTKPIAANGTVRLKVAGNGPVPASGATAVVLNVTVTVPTAAGFITAYPGGTTLPNASNVNFTRGETVPNLVTVPLGADGTVSLSNRSSGTSHLVADVFGYYTVGGGHAFVPLKPVRVLDTRNGIGQETVAHRVAANGDQVIYTEGGEILVGMALVLNVTAVGPKAAGFVTAYQQGIAVPATSNLNFTAGETVPNMVISKTQVVLHNSSPGTTDLVADAFGYFS